MVVLHASILTIILDDREIEMVEVLITAIVAIVSAVLGWLLSHYWQSKSYSLAVDNERSQWNTDVEMWARNVIEVLSRLRYQFDTMEQSKAVEVSSELSLQLSILIDQGRLYFPNVMRECYGQHKQPSRQGYRSFVLDPLVAAFKISKGTALYFDVSGGNARYGNNMYSRALQVYQNAFLSFIEAVLLIQKTHDSLIKRLDETGDSINASKLKSILSPENKKDPSPRGAEYWLGEHGGIPNEADIIGATAKPGKPS